MIGPGRPMFPLGTVLVPGAPLLLRVFEPRYLALVADCLDGDGRFGVVLIERGSEVGGGDVRSAIGTLARIERAEAVGSGGILAVAVVGEQRLRVTRWLEDAPYPEALVEPWPDPPPGPRYDQLLGEAVALLRRSLALLAEARCGGAPGHRLARPRTCAGWLRGPRGGPHRDVGPPLPLGRA